MSTSFREELDASVEEPPRSHSPQPLLGHSTYTKYRPLQQTDERSVAESQPPRSIALKRGQTIALERDKQWLKGYIGIVIITVGALVLLLFCVASFATHGIFHNVLAPQVIGGRLTYVQAKAIDFVSTAFLGPLVMVGLDFLWFSCARTTIINERQDRQGVPLPSLVYASNVSSGGFNVFKLQSFFSAGTWRLVMFGILFALSGLAAKLLNNVLAYQAFEIPVPQANTTNLRLLSGAPLQMYDTGSPLMGIGLQLDGLEVLSTPQQSTIANQITGLLTGVNFQSANSSLEPDGSYIGTNATSASLNNLDPNITQLNDVPAYRLTAACAPFQAGMFSGLPMGETYYTLSVSSQGEDGEMFTASIPGQMTLNNPTANNDEYPFVAFELGGQSTYLGTLWTFNDTNSTYNVNSSYGTVLPYAFATGWNQSTKGIMTTWGVNCSIYRQDGRTNMARPLGGSWGRTNNTFSSNKISVTSALFDYQKSLNYNAPLSTIAGLGPALAQTAGTASALGTSDSDSDGSSLGFGTDNIPINFTTYALNYLYTSGEARRITYEVLANKSNSMPDLYYNVTSHIMVQHYRITYIPLLLFLALLVIFIAALIPLFMASQANKAITFRTARPLDGLSLLVDAVAGLRDSAPEMSAAAEKQGGSLNNWAKRVRVRLALHEHEKGAAGIKLTRVDGQNS